MKEILMKIEKLYYRHISNGGVQVKVEVNEHGVSFVHLQGDYYGNPFVSSYFVGLEP